MPKIDIFSAKLKKGVHYLPYVCTFFIVCMLAPNVRAQDIEGTLPSADSVGIISPNDTIPPEIAVETDSLAGDSLTVAADTLRQPQGDIQTTIKYTAEDSTLMDARGRSVILYGEAQVDYGEISLKADYIELDWTNNMLTARGREDSTGAVVGKPVFKDGSEEYQTEEIRYNFKTRRAFITGVLTKPEATEGFVYGEVVKKNEDNEVFINRGWYTPCDCEPGEIPDLYIKSRRMKVVPNNLVATGPFNLVIADIPTPLGLPFGIFPMPSKQNSGIIPPRYGEERRRGFFLQDFGYYFDVNDYVNLTLLGSIFSKGSYGFSVISDYYKRYAYRGGLNFQFNRQFVDPDSEDRQVAKDFRLTFRHTPQSRGASRFSANVNVATSSYIQNNPSVNVISNLTTTLSSSVSYSTAFRNTPFNLSMSARHSQNLLSGTVSVLLPDVSLNMNRIYPFKNLVTSRSNWISKINVGYQMSGRNEFTNDRLRLSSTLPFNKLADPSPLTDSVLAVNGDNLSEILNRTQTGVQHTIPISTSFSVLNFVTASPSFQYREVWSFKRYSYSYDPATELVDIDTIPGFNRASSWNASMGFSTRVYGTYYFGKGEGKIQAMRHTLIPTFSVGYSPNFADRYTDTVRISNERVIVREGVDNNVKRVPIYDESVFRAPTSAQTGSIGFSLNNNLELKVRNDNDTSQNAEATKKIPIFESLSFSTSYNVIADSFKLAPISMAARTRLFKNKISINVSASVDPYTYVKDPSVDTVTQADGAVFDNYIRYDQYAWNRSDVEVDINGTPTTLPSNTGRFGTLTRASVALSTNLNPEASKKKEERAESASIAQEDLDYIDQNRQDYVDFDIPWSLNVRYSFTYTNNPTRVFRKEGRDRPEDLYSYTPNNRNSPFRQSVSLNGDVNLTPKWKIGFTSGYDFQAEQITQSSVNVFRDLDCFDFRFDWIPFGRFTSFYVQVNVKSSILRDLKLQRRRTWQDTGF